MTTKRAFSVPLICLALAQPLAAADPADPTDRADRAYPAGPAYPAGRTEPEPASLDVPAPAPRPGPEEAVFHRDVGVWDMRVELRTEPGAKAIVAKGVSHNQLGGGGFWLESHSDLDIVGVPFQGHAIYGYDRVKRKYVGVWVDTTDFYPALAEGTYDAARKVLSLAGDMRAPDGSMVPTRRVTEWKDDDTRILRILVKTSDGSDFETMTITYSRRK